MDNIIISYPDGSWAEQSFEEYEKERNELEDYSRAMITLDECGVPRTDETPCEYSLVGRIIWLADNKKLCNRYKN